jgi:heme/copper-type cytochrome/quinol oxidase subunit 2
MNPQTKKVILISLWCFLAFIFLAVVGWYVYYLIQYKTYKDTQHKFSIKYPSDWEMKSDFAGTAVAFIRPKQTALDVFQPNANVSLQDVPAHIATLASFSKTITKQLTAIFEKNITIVEDKDFTFSGRAGHRLVIEAPKPENLKAVFVWTIKGSSAYIFTYMSRIDQYKELSPKVDEMIKSFKFNP